MKPLVLLLLLSLTLVAAEPKNGPYYTPMMRKRGVIQPVVQVTINNPLPVHPVSFGGAVVEADDVREPEKEEENNIFTAESGDPVEEKKKLPSGVVYAEEMPSEEPTTFTSESGVEPKKIKKQKKEEKPKKPAKQDKDVETSVEVTNPDRLPELLMKTSNGKTLHIHVHSPRNTLVTKTYKVYQKIPSGKRVRLVKTINEGEDTEVKKGGIVIGGPLERKVVIETIVQTKPCKKGKSRFSSGASGASGPAGHLQPSGLIVQRRQDAEYQAMSGMSGPVGEEQEEENNSMMMDDAFASGPVMDYEFEDASGASGASGPMDNDDDDDEANEEAKNYYAEKKKVASSSVKPASKFRRSLNRRRYHR